MAVVNCNISITSAAIPNSQDSNISPANPKPPKIILPKRKPQKWSTGTASGKYGGPPVTTKLRKYWGGEREDPITSDEFIWNKDFMPRMKLLFQDSTDDPQFYQLSMEVDLSKELSAPVKPAIAKQVEKAQDAMLRELRWPQGSSEVLAAQSREQYFKLKNKLQILTLGIGGVGLLSAYVSYTPEIAASYGVGLLGSFAYMCMLGNSVDSMADGARGLVKGSIGQPRLLVPVVLVMIYNRWNGSGIRCHAPGIDTDACGIFTYKIVTFTQAIEDALTIVGKKSEV